MNDLGAFFSNLIEKFDFKKLMISAFIVLSLMLVPRINYLNFLMPLDSSDKWIMFVFAIISAYIALSVIVFVWRKVVFHFKYRPQKAFMLMGEYGKYINVFYSEEINEYSYNSVDLSRYDIPPDVIEKLLDNNIIEHSSYNYPKYRLTKKARKKLTRLKKIIMFIDRKIINRNKGDEKNG